MNTELSLRINSGDKAALKEFLTAVTRNIYDIAQSEVNDKDLSMDIVKKVLQYVRFHAERGACPIDLDNWVEQLVRERCAMLLDTNNTLEVDAIVSHVMGDEDSIPDLSCKLAESNGNEYFNPTELPQRSSSNEGSNPSATPSNAAQESSISEIERTSSHSVAIVDIMLIVLLSLFTLIMAWTIIVMLICNGMLEDFTNGFATGYAEWFNVNLFELFRT